MVLALTLQVYHPEVCGHFPTWKLALLGGSICCPAGVSWGQLWECYMRIHHALCLFQEDRNACMDSPERMGDILGQ